MDEMNRALVFTVCERPDYLRQTLESWWAVRGLERWPVAFHVEPTDVRPEVLEVLAHFPHPDARIVLNRRRFGVLSNPWHALNLAFEEAADFVVLAEEDILVAEDTLEYMEWASAEFAASQGVLAVCAGGPYPAPEPHATYRDVQSQIDFGVHIWGTWSDRWATHLRDSWDHDYSTGVGHGKDAIEAGWDWNIAKRIMPANELVTVAPYVSRAEHIGQHGGVHMRPRDFRRQPGWSPVVPPTDYELVSEPAL